MNSESNNQESSSQEAQLHILSILLKIKEDVEKLHECVAEMKEIQNQENSEIKSEQEVD